MATSEDQPCWPLLTTNNELIHLKLTQPTQDALTSTVVPGWPLLSLADEQGIRHRLQADLSTERLRRLYSILFLTSRPENISPLHHQAIKRRDIIITEQPDMHLLWYYDRIFIKPIPKYLLSAHFWERHVVRKAPNNVDLGSRGKAEEEGDCMMQEAMGFLRTYSRLIQHESDFELAQKLGLIPREPNITWVSWSRYIASFATLRDRDLSKRYHFGEIRMTRLNFWTTVLHGNSYEPVHYNYMTYFARFGAPYLFIFGAVTVLLTALQTGLDINQHGKGRTVYHDLATGFVPFALFLTMGGLTLVPMLFLVFYFLEWYNFLFHYQPHS